MSNTIIVVEDDETLADNLRDYLERQGFEAIACGTAEAALEMIAGIEPDLVVSDHNLPGMSGTQLVGKIREIDPQIKVIMMTGDDRVQTAVDAMKAGAYDYLTKPVALAELKLVVDRALGARKLETALSFHKERQAKGAGVDAMIGTSQAIKDLKTTIARILDAEKRMVDGDLPAILIHGETGTGKELVARSLHFDGPRRDGPFVEVNCASIPSHLLEAELFGYERGAFTDAKERKQGLVEAADGGTLFLDEIGEIDSAMQVKLLKLIEEKKLRRLGSVKEQKVNLRIISATNRDLEQMVREGRFRGDLYFRLRILSLNTPPLRMRGPDILLLARHFLAEHGRRYGKTGLFFNPEAEQVLLSYAWPGNVRELRNMLEQTVLLAPSLEVTPNQLAICPGLVPNSGNERSYHDNDSYCMSFPQKGVKLSEVERDLVVKALEKTDWNVTKSAKLLGLSRDMLRYRIEKLDLRRPLN
jgi:two-component system response regulator AtoC